MKGEVFRKAMSDPPGDRDKLGERTGATIVSARNTENLAAIAEVHLSACTTGTRSTINSGVKCDAVARPESMYVLAGSFYYSSGFMSHNERRNTPSGGSIVAVNVAAADSTGRHANEQFVGAHGWNRNIGDLKVSIFG